MLRERAATPGPIAAAVLLAAVLLAGCGIKGPLKQPPSAPAVPGAAPAASEPAAGDAPKAPK